MSKAATPEVTAALRDAVLALGVPADEVARAEADGTLELLALERAVDTEPPSLDLDQVASRSRSGARRDPCLLAGAGFPRSSAG